MAEKKALSLPLDTRRGWVEPHPGYSLRRQCRLAGVPRSGFYYEPVAESEQNLHLMRLIDEQYLRHPEYGSPRMTESLRDQGHAVNRKRVARLMRQMGLQAITPGPHTSRPAPGHRVYPYLLRDMKIRRVHQVWSMDITFVPVQKGLSVSCNTIGFVRKSLITGYNLMQNPLIASNNTVAALFMNPPDALTLYFWDYASQGYGPICSYDFGEWTNGETIALPGEGFWLQNPTSAYTEVIFVGEVADGYHEISVTDAWDLVGTPIPIEGKVGADLVFPAVNNNEIRKSIADGTGNYITYKYINGIWNKYINNTWVPEEPYFEMAEAFFTIKTEGLWWRRNFTPWTGDFEYLE